MQPMNYMIDVQQPFANALSGVQAGLGLSQAMDQNAARQQDLAQKQYALEQQKQMQTDLGVLATKQNPTAQDFAAITTKYPQLAEHFKNTWSMLNQDQQQARLGQASQVYAALNAGKPEIAKDLLGQQIAAAKNSGNTQDAQHAETMLKLIDQNPQVALNSAGLMLSSVLGPEKFTTTFSTLAKLPGEVRQGEATATQKEYEAKNTPQRLDLENRYKGTEIRNLDSQIRERAARLGLDRDKLQSETELKLYELNQKGGQLDDGAKKLINDSTVASVSADQSSGQLLDLATRLEKQGGGYGTFSRANEWLKGATGNQDAMTEMRKEYIRLRQSQVRSMLPAGPASDKDVKLALEGFPPETADAGTMASFLRGMAKLQQYQAVSENAKAEWVNAVGHLGKPKTDITIDGVKVPAGTTFVDFARQYMPSKTEQRGREQGQAQVPNASYMKWLQSQGAR